MDIIEINVQTKEIKTRDYTSAELTQRQAMQDESSASALARADTERAMTVEQKLARIGIALSELKTELAR